jgi:hypothetical protein
LGFSAGFHTTRGVFFLLGRFFPKMLNAVHCVKYLVLLFMLHRQYHPLFTHAAASKSRGKKTLNRLFTACHQQPPASSVAEGTREESSRPPACVA